jgi:hypothetical protein
VFFFSGKSHFNFYITNHFLLKKIVLQSNGLKISASHVLSWRELLSWGLLIHFFPVEGGLKVEPIVIVTTDNYCNEQNITLEEINSEHPCFALIVKKLILHCQIAIERELKYCIFKFANLAWSQIVFNKSNNQSNCRYHFKVCSRKECVCGIVQRS